MTSGQYTRALVVELVPSVQLKAKMHQPSTDRAIQRHRAYQLLSAMYTEGLTADVFALCKAIPSLEPLLPEPYDEDMARADHQELFGFNVFPFTGVYLAEDGRPGGQYHQDLNVWYFSHGFNASELHAPSDHIGSQLAFLSFLAGLEIEAHLAPSGNGRVSSIRRAQGEFVQTQFLTWSLPFLAAVKMQSNPLYAEVADLTLAMLIDQVQEVGTKGTELDVKPVPIDILGDHNAGLKQISEYMARPVHSGFYFSKKDLKSIARKLEIPTGFGDRVQVLTNTFRSAISFDVLPAFLRALKEHAGLFNNEYEMLCQATDDRLTYLIEPWITRIETMLLVLGELEKAGVSD